MVLRRPRLYRRSLPVANTRWRGVFTNRAHKVLEVHLGCNCRGADVPHRRESTQRYVAASVADCIFWIVVLVALILLFFNNARERWGGRIALAAFALVLCYWTFLAFAHAQALTRGRAAATRLASANGEAVGRTAAMPRLANPFRWDFVFETDRATYRFDVGVMDGTTASEAVRYPKPAGELKDALDSIAQQKPVRVFLGFARFPVLQFAEPDCVTSTLVQLADLRYTEPGQSRGSFSLEVPVECPNEQSGR